MTAQAHSGVRCESAVWKKAIRIVTNAIWLRLVKKEFWQILNRMFLPCLPNGTVKMNGLPVWSETVKTVLYITATESAVIMMTAKTGKN